jgi:hypothetical protein
MSGTRFSFREKRRRHQPPAAPREQDQNRPASVGRRPLVIGGTMSGTRFSFREERRRHQPSRGRRASRT